MVNKKIYLSMIAIGIATAITGAGTWAYFTDTVTSTGNKLTAEILYLGIGNGHGDYENFSVYNVKPGDTNKFAGQIIVINNCSSNGWLSARILNVTGDSNLAEDLSLKIYSNSNSNHPIGTINSLSNNTVLFSGQGLSQGKSKTFVFRYNCADNGEDNYQGQNCSFNIEFNLLHG